MGGATHLLTQTVAFQAPTGARTSNGDPVFGATQTLPCRHERKVDTIRSGAGVVLAESTVIITETAIPAGALVWLDGAGVGDRKQAKAVQLSAQAAKPFGGYTLYETRL
jgi:hypothetical protein